MKSTFALLLILCFGISVYAQNGISFQGIARDPQGNAIVNKTIPVKFTIGSFTESQNLTTDNFGVFSATIGSVNTSGFNSLVFANISSNLKVEVDGTTIYDDKFNTVPYAKAAENGVPPGCIMPFAGLTNQIPEGWLLCNGESKPKVGTYQKLYEAIGTLWGDDGGNFKIPDLRGMFLRGSNEGRSDVWKDPDTRSVGNFQTDSIQSHDHSNNFSIAQNGEHNHTMGITTMPFDNDSWDEWGYGYIESTSATKTTSNNGLHSHVINGNIHANGGNETRPNNAAVVYIIKY